MVCILYVRGDGIAIVKFIHRYKNLEALSDLDKIAKLILM